MKIYGNVAIFEVQTRFADGNANLCNTDIIHLIEQMFCMKKKIYQFFFCTCIYVFQTDIFGVCPTGYRVSESYPDLFYTERNLRLCDMPQIYSRPRNILSMIQKPYGGYKIGKVLEVIFKKHYVNAYGISS